MGRAAFITWGERKERALWELAGGSLVIRPPSHSNGQSIREHREGASSSLGTKASSVSSGLVSHIHQGRDEGGTR